MTHGLFLRGLVVVGFACGLLAACVSDPVLEDRVNPDEGAVQPQVDLGGSSARLSEAEACDMLLEAVEAAEDDLDCDVDRDAPLTCPDLLRASAPGCSEYARNTVEECADRIADYGSCEEFRSRPCIVSALSDEGCMASVADASMEPGGLDAGSGAAGSDAGVSSDAGSP